MGVVIRSGDVLRGKYMLESSIGKGGMGEVFCAYDSAGQRRVAVKVVSRQVIGDILMARLQREAIAAVRVKSDYVPQLLDVDTTEEGEVFLVMELLRGQTLTQRLKQRGHLSWDELSYIGRDVLCGLVDAHAAGVVHRDLKPSNIFLELARPGRGERARILDFGVCKLDAPDGERLTTTGESVGTVAYMAPEQIRGASKVDERADLYSFGTVVFEALTGRLAHDASGQMAMLASKLERPASRLADCALVPTPPELDALVARLLARDPAERLATAREVLGAWEALGPATVEPRAYAFDAATIAAPAGATQTSLTAGTGSILPSSRGSRLPLVVAAGAVAMSLGVFGAMLLARAPGDEGRAQAGEETARSSGAHAAPPTSAAAAVAEAPSLAGTATAPASAPAFGAPAGTASSGVAPAVSTDGDWITVAPATLDLTVDAGLSAAARPSRRRYGRPSAPATTKRGTGEPRIEDRPRY